MRTLIVLIIITLSGSVLAQTEEQSTFRFRGNMEKLDAEVDLSFLRNHFMGETIAKKLYLLKEGYTWVEAATSTNPVAMTYVDKPAIYNSVKKLERYYKKRIKKGQISEQDAIDEFSRVLDVAIVIRNEQTLEFEEFLDNIKEEEQIVAVFTQNVELRY